MLGLAPGVGQGQCYAVSEGLPGFSSLREDLFLGLSDGVRLLDCTDWVVKPQRLCPRGWGAWGARVRVLAGLVCSLLALHMAVPGCAPECLAASPNPFL